MILMDVLPRGQMINSDVYVETLKKCFQGVCPHKDVTKVLLHHNNARPDTSVHTQEAITKLQWTVLPHPPYILELAPSNYHLFSPLKDAICKKKFEDNEEVISEVKRWLQHSPTEWYREGIQVFTSWWRKAIDSERDYVEKIVFHVLYVLHARKWICDLSSSSSYTKNNSQVMYGLYVQWWTFYAADA
jgi:hypothetical protein